MLKLENWSFCLQCSIVEPKSGESSDEDEEQMGAGNFASLHSRVTLHSCRSRLISVSFTDGEWLVMFSCLKQVWTVSVGPKIKEMSPSAKEKIREDVQDAMAEKEEGKFHTQKIHIWK